MLLKRAATSEQTDGGIYLPQRYQGKNREAEVIRLGIGKDDKGKDVEFSVKPGDCVILKDNAGIPVSDDDHLLAYEHELIGLVEETA